MVFNGIAVIGVFVGKKVNLLAYDAAGTEEACRVVGCCYLVNFDAGRAGGVYECDFTADRVRVDGNGHVAHTARAGGASGEEQQVAGLHFLAADFLALGVLGG